MDHTFFELEILGQPPNSNSVIKWTRVLELVTYTVHLSHDSDSVA
jgi:hypothetical protein